jgi:transposase-like protein
VRKAKPKIPKCHSCHRRALRFIEKRDRYLCDSCGKVFDIEVVERHNPGLVERQIGLGV